MLDKLKKLPKRPRGRPKGQALKPKTLEELVAVSLTEGVIVPPRPKRKNPHTGERYYARLARENREALVALSKKAADRPRKGEQTPGKPQRTTNEQWADTLDYAQKLAHRIYITMDTEGALPENLIAREAMKKAVELLASDVAVKDKIAVIRTLLEYNMAKPAATSNLNIKTAEDFLDQLAADSDG